MIVFCSICSRLYDDEFRLTFCPHDTFPANDGHNNFSQHPESVLSELTEDIDDMDQQISNGTLIKGEAHHPKSALSKPDENRTVQDVIKGQAPHFVKYRRVIRPK